MQCKAKQSKAAKTKKKNKHKKVGNARHIHLVQLELWQWMSNRTWPDANYKLQPGDFTFTVQAESTERCQSRSSEASTQADISTVRNLHCTN